MADPYVEKLAELVRRIYYQTEEGKIRWQELDLVSEDYIADLNGRKISIGIVNYEIEGEPTQDVEIGIYNNADTKIESIRDSRLGGATLAVSGFSGWYTLMLHIYETARRQVNGSEDAINELLKSLDDIPF